MLFCGHERSCNRYLQPITEGSVVTSSSRRRKSTNSLTCQSRTQVHPNMYYPTITSKCHYKELKHFYKMKENYILHRRKALSITLTKPRIFFFSSCRSRKRNNLGLVSVMESSAFPPMQVIANLSLPHSTSKSCSNILNRNMV